MGSECENNYYIELTLEEYVNRISIAKQYINNTIDNLIKYISDNLEDNNIDTYISYSIEDMSEAIQNINSSETNYQNEYQSETLPIDTSFQDLSVEPPSKKVSRTKIIRKCS